MGSWPYSLVLKSLFSFSMLTKYFKNKKDENKKKDGDKNVSLFSPQFQQKNLFLVVSVYYKAQH